MTKKEIEFLKESNAIEGVYDQLSMQQAAFAWEYLKGQKKMTIAVILKTHKILMLHQSLLPNQKGYFRTQPVWVGGREGVDYEKIHDEMEQWCLNVMDMIHNGKNEPVIFIDRLIKEHHVKYEHIHPFIDGNGRTGRMFLNWERKHLKLPILIIHEGLEQMQYYKWFR